MNPALKGKKVCILLESDFAEPEIFYYQHRFIEDGMEAHFMTRLWGQPYLTFRGHEQHYPIECHESFENMSDAELRSYSAVIMPGGFISDRLRYTEDPNKISPATEFMKRAFAEPGIIKGINCHGLWLISAVPELVRGRRLTCHSNLAPDARNMGANYVNEEVVIDGDLVTGCAAHVCHSFARAILDKIAEREVAR